MTETFRGMHQSGEPLLLGNVWDVSSARICQEMKFRALGTSSAAVAAALGYEDGQKMPFSAYCSVIGRIRQSVELPLSVDLEWGYGETAREISENIALLHGMGISGINLEDSRVEKGKRGFQEPEQFARKLEDLLARLKQSNIRIFLNLRCDAFLLPAENPLALAVEKIRCYEQLGVDGIFLPGIVQEADIRAVVATTRLPLNVLTVPGLPGLDALRALGVKRISTGNFIHDRVYAGMKSILTTVLNGRDHSIVL